MKDTLIGIDLAKNVFQLHGASMTGDVQFRKKLVRSQFLRFMASQARRWWPWRRAAAHITGRAS